MKTREFKYSNDGKELTFLVRSPSINDQKEANKVYNTAFSEAIKAKALVRAKLDDVLVEQGLWDTNKQESFNKLQNNILEGERLLAKGGISLKEAKKQALNMRKHRGELRDLISVKTNLDTHTAEGQADNARFNYLVSSCLVYNDTKEPYFKGYEDYLNKAADPVAVLAAQNLAAMLYGLESDYEEKLPENKFLKKYKFIDTNLRLVNEKSQLVDEENRLIDEKGRFINEAGQFVDKDGNPVDKDGEYVVEFSPFLDDSGKPIKEESKQEPQQHEQEQNKAEPTENINKPILDEET
jgi:hypothetical protein